MPMLTKQATSEVVAVAEGPFMYWWLVSPDTRTSTREPQSAACQWGGREASGQVDTGVDRHCQLSLCWARRHKAAQKQHCQAVVGIWMYVCPQHSSMQCTSASGVHGWGHFWCLQE